MLICATGIVGCQSIETGVEDFPNTSIYAQTSENHTSSYKTETSKSQSAISSQNQNNTSSKSHKKVSSEIDLADKKRYEYVKNHQVNTKKAKNMSKNELSEFIEKLIYSTSSLSTKIDLPESLIFTKGTIICTFEQEHVLSEQSVSFEDFVGEFKPEELQAFLSQFPEKIITTPEEGVYDYPMVLPRYQDLFITQSNVFYIDLVGGLKNIFNGSLGTAMIPILIYEKENGMYAFHFDSRLNNPDYLVGELEIQPDGSAKVVNTGDGSVS